MEWNHHKGVGYIGLEYRHKLGPGGEKAQEFLEKMAVEFAKLSCSYYERLEDFPFAYKESQVTPYLFASILNARLPRTSALSEHPIKRRNKGKVSRAGWMDLWVLHNDVALLIEVKHRIVKVDIELFSPQKKEPDKVLRKLEKAVRQLRNIKSKSLKDLYYWDERERDAFRVALLVSPVRQKGNYGQINEGRRSKEEVNALVEQFSRQIEQTRGHRPACPNWRAAWCLNTSLQKPWKCNDGTSYENYPAVLFFARIKHI